MIDVGALGPERPTITLRLDQIARVLGIAIDRRDGRRGSCGRSAWSRWAGRPRLADVPAAELAERPGARDRPDRGGRPDPRLRAHPRGPGRPPGQTPRGPSRAGRGRDPRSLLTGAGFDEAVTFSLVADELVAPARARTPAAPPIRVEHSSRKREQCAPAEPGAEPAGRPPAQRGARQRSTPTCSRSPTSTSPDPVSRCPTSRPA